MTDHEHDAKQLERLTFFSDAVYAIAMTLLVIDIRLPSLSPPTDAELRAALARLLPAYVGFVVSFLVIGRFWVAHHRAFGLLRRTSGRLIQVNLLSLLTVAFMPFPTAVVSERGDLQSAVALYGAWLMVMGVAQHALMRVALHRPGLVRDDAPDADIRQLLLGSLTPLAIGAVTVGFAIVSPLAAVVFLIAGSPVVYWLFHRPRRQLAPPAA